MQMLLSVEEGDALLLAELGRLAPESSHRISAPGLVLSSFAAKPTEVIPPVVFARQWFPDPEPIEARSVREWSEQVADIAIERIPEPGSWLLHVTPHYGQGSAGQHRCEWIRATTLETLRRRRRHLLRRLRHDAAPFLSSDSLLQVLLTGPEAGVVSVSAGPAPAHWHRLLSPFAGGEVEKARDLQAPSRAFAKLLEAEARLGRAIQAGDRCVDLGAAPGSWSYVVLRRGASVVAVDRAPVRTDLMRHPRLQWQRGDAFTYRPEETVDWLLCDVIAVPDRSIDLLLAWLRRGWTRFFVITIKFKGISDYGKLDRLRQELPTLAADFLMTRLCANRNEVCVAGVARAT